MKRTSNDKAVKGRLGEDFTASYLEKNGKTGEKAEEDCNDNNA